MFFYCQLKLKPHALRRVVFSLFLVGGLTTSVTGCARATLGRVTDSNALPAELTQEEKDKFDIKELAEPKPAPSPALIVVSAPQGKRRSRKKEKMQAKVINTSLTEAKLVSVAPSPVPFSYVSRRPPQEPIWPGEKMTFDITYFGVGAGDLDLEALPYKTIDNRKTYHIKGTAVSSKVFSIFYRLHDTVESFIDYEGMFSHRFHVVLDETKQSRDSLELNDSRKEQTYYWSRWNHKDRGYSETKEYKPIQSFSQDSLSAMYYLRTVPLPDGAVVTVPIISEGKTWEAVVTVVRREMMDTPMGKVRVVVLNPETKYQGILKKQGESFLWLTDDDRRIPVRLEAKVRIGTVIANLKKFEPGTAPAKP